MKIYALIVLFTILLLGIFGNITYWITIIDPTDPNSNDYMKKLCETEIQQQAYKQEWTTFYQKVFDQWNGDVMKLPWECKRIKIPLYQNKYITKIREDSLTCIQSYYIKDGKLWLWTNCSNLEKYEFSEELYIMDVEHVREIKYTYMRTLTKQMLSGISQQLIKRFHYMFS